MQLIGTQNAKTIKGEKKGWLTGVLYLAPHTCGNKDRTVCPKATRDCKSVCLYSAGRGQFTSVQNARIRKTKLLWSNRKEFIAQLCQDIRALQRKADRKGMGLAIRLNGTSDLPWHSKEFGDIPAKFPAIQFYDYTRVLSRVSKVKRANYYLLGSRDSTNERQCRSLLAKGHNIAVCFRRLPSDKLWWGHRVISGDDNDLRFKDPSGCVVGLTAKGAARKSQVKFVVVPD
jgi:hypothetical protein